MKRPTRAAQAIAAGVLVAGGFGAGAVAAMTGSADAATGSTSSTSSATPGSGTEADGDGGGHAGETPLTGDTAAQVQAAALAAYPGATIDRLETDSDGVYEAHVTTADGSELIVQVGTDFSVTGTDTGGGGDHDGDGPGAADASGAASAS